MKAISLWQPWASAIAHGSKDFETRSWQVPCNLLGETVAIHAAKKRIKIEDLEELFHSCFPLSERDLWGDEYEDLPFGAVVASAEIVECYTTEQLFELRGDDFRMTDLGRRLCIGKDEVLLGDFSPGRYAWHLRATKLPIPIECKGAQSFFDLPADVAVKVREQYRRTR